MLSRDNGKVWPMATPTLFHAERANLLPQRTHSESRDLRSLVSLLLGDPVVYVGNVNHSSCLTH
jgi:hypothetical protein